MSPELVQEKPYDHNSDLWFVVPHSTPCMHAFMHTRHTLGMSLKCKGCSCLALYIMLCGYVTILRFSLKLGNENKNLGILDKQRNNCIAIEVYCVVNEIRFILQYLMDTACRHTPPLSRHLVMVPGTFKHCVLMM